MADMTLQMWWDTFPWWMKFGQILVMWAILCVGICLPLITLKLYWHSIHEYFSDKPRSVSSQQLYEIRRAEEARKRESEKVQLTVP